MPTPTEVDRATYANFGSAEDTGKFLAALEDWQHEDAKGQPLTLVPPVPAPEPWKPISAKEIGDKAAAVAAELYLDLGTVNTGNILGALSRAYLRGRLDGVESIIALRKATAL